MDNGGGVIDTSSESAAINQWLTMPISRVHDSMIITPLTRIIQGVPRNMTVGE